MTHFGGFLLIFNIKPYLILHYDYKSSIPLAKYSLIGYHMLTGKSLLDAVHPRIGLIPDTGYIGYERTARVPGVQLKAEQFHLKK